MGFFDHIGKLFLDVETLDNYLKNPIAQELAAILEYSNKAKNFVDKDWEGMAGEVKHSATNSANYNYLTSEQFEMLTKINF